MPLTYREQVLIDAAITQSWTPQLRERLAMAVRYRGIAVKYYDNCGDLAETLELAALEERVMARPRVTPVPTDPVEQRDRFYSALEEICSDWSDWSEAAALKRVLRIAEDAIRPNLWPPASEPEHPDFQR